MRITSLAVAAFAGALSATSVLAAPFDAVTDFSLAQNPNGTWSYGSGTTGTTFTPFNMQGCGIPGLSCWHGVTVVPNLQPLELPYVGKNTIGSTIDFSTVSIPVGVLDLHPGVADTIVAWTAPVAGNFQFAGQFQLIDHAPTGVVAKIVEGADTLFDQALSGAFGATTNFAFSRHMDVGDTLYFGVNQGTIFFNDSTAFALTITEAPQCPNRPALRCWVPACWG
jgi:hypothetical protein